MTSNLGSEDIRAASPMLHKLVAKTEGRHEQYLKGTRHFVKQLYPVLKESFKRDEISDRTRVNSWLVHLFINDSGDIDMAKEDPIGKLQYLLSLPPLIRFITGRIPQRGCHYVF
jgi:ATP-dependent Clp protease ATP-binding subunit ClpB